MQTKYVAGEPAHQLVQALSQFKRTPSNDGMVHFEVQLDAGLGTPLQRAIMRIEAELLLQDADSLTPASSRELRTADQRRADALIGLVHRLNNCDR